MGKLNFFFDLVKAEWTRFFPVYRELKTKLVKDGELGEPRVMFATFGVKGLNDVDRIKIKELGGSVTLDIGELFQNYILYQCRRPKNDKYLRRPHHGWIGRRASKILGFYTLLVG